MTREPTLLSEACHGQKANLRLFVPSSLVFFQGHFRDFPILPGVVQLDWAIRHGRRHFTIPGHPATLKVKFPTPLRPETEITLALTFEPERQRLRFECRGGALLHAIGEIGFTTRIGFRKR
ncbi:MAG TPA: hypothetical protein VKT70_00440 [Stellaceae bacterium]|nr:hypothetical protein [Stellaceae bacterium]